MIKTEALGDFEGVAGARLVQLQLEGGGQFGAVECHRAAHHTVLTLSPHLQPVQVGGGQAERAPGPNFLQKRLSQGGARFGLGAGAQFIQQHQ